MKNSIFLITLLSVCIAPNLYANDSEHCGAMCHLPMAWQNNDSCIEMSYRGPTSKQGTFSNMKQRLGIQPDHEQAWDEFSKAVLTGSPEFNNTQRNNNIRQAFTMLKHVVSDQQRAQIACHFGSCGQIF
ncbi:MAG: hypothetical protein HQL54_05985 [Magnetococcales bacterium]|nr:hypothetical protein [Magnetococcales bacterium]